MFDRWRFRNPECSLLNLALSHHGRLPYLWLCLRRRPFYEYYGDYELTLVACNELSTRYVVHHRLWEETPTIIKCRWPRYRLLSLSHSIVINGALLVLDLKSVRVASGGVEWPLRSRSWGKVRYPTITPVEYSLVVFLSTLVRACRLARNYRPWASILKSRWYDSGFQCPLLMFLWSKCRQSFHTGTVLYLTTNVTTWSFGHPELRLEVRL